MPFTVRYTFDDARVRAQLSAVRKRALNLDPALKEIGIVLRQSTRQRFLDGRGPDGRAWKPLSLKAIVHNYKARSGKSILKKRGGVTAAFEKYRAGRRVLIQGGMRGGLMGSITYQTGPGWVEVGSVKVYAAIHQLGGKTKAHVIRPKRAKALAWPGGPGPRASVKHPGSVIPARPFLGVSRSDHAEIRRILLRHLGAPGAR